jgi:hypothetical protein
MIRTIIISIIFICLLHFNVSAQTANAGADQTIYLQQGSTATLDGSGSSATSYLWTEFSTDYSSGATITSPTSKTTTVTGLPQGVFYFEIAATTGGTTKRDSVKVTVDAFLQPKNSILSLRLPFDKSDFAYMVNRRDDTSHYLTYVSGKEAYWDYHMPDGVNELYLERDRAQLMMLDSMRGKLYTTIQDAYHAPTDSFARSTLTYGEGYAFDTLRTYVLDWKAYFPASIKAVFATSPYWGRVAINGMHGNDGGSGSTTIALGYDSLAFASTSIPTGMSGFNEVGLGNSDSWVNQTHTVRIYVREGSKYPNQKGFIKLLLDGNELYYCDTGLIGKTLMQDYYKLTGLYDYRNLIVNIDSLTRYRKFSMVTENSDIWVMNATPTVDAGADQSIATTSTTLSGNANDLGVGASSKIVSYLWTKISGGTATITSPTDTTTTVTGLSSGTYQFQLKAVDDSGYIGYDTMQVIVSTGTAAPTVSVSGNQTIITSSTSVYATATWASGHSGTYLWTQTSGTSATIGSPTASSTTLTGLTGHNTFKCTATQDDSQTANGSVNVYVDYATANAGGNQTITLPTSSVTLNGSGTSSDGTISSYWWTQISGPNSASFGTPALATTTATGLIQGTYVFNLLVTDSYGATANNTATITVNPAVPIIIPGTKITLYGVFKVIND